jgi:hypothetical protein
MITMRAQEDSGIQEELKTSGINKENLYMEKEVVAISVAASMLWLVGTTKGKNSCMFASVVDDVVAYGRKQQKVEVLVISLIKEA